MGGGCLHGLHVLSIDFFGVFFGFGVFCMPLSMINTQAISPELSVLSWFPRPLLK